MAKDKEHYPHLEWLGYVQPVGLVVSVPALLAAQAHVTRNIGAEHQQYLASLTEDKEGRLSVSELSKFAETVLGWDATDLVDFSQLPGVPPDLEVALPEYGETLAPTHAVKQFVPAAAGDGQPPAWQILIQSIPRGQDFDAIPDLDDRAWQATPQAKFERLLRETRIPIGLLFNHTAFRLVYAPRGETSGYMTFRVQDMAEPAGRPIFAAFHMLLSVERLVTLPEKQRLPAILESSRKYQSVVSTQLAGQVLQALFELVRGFQAADAVAKGKLLEQVLADDPNHVYHGLLTVLMRLVFILYAEDRNLLSADSVYTNHYSLTGLFERLRSDAGRHHDTMNQRFGAWAQLLTLFRLTYDGGSHANLRIPPRHGYLFDPERYRFLEGRATPHDSLQQLPHVSDGVVYRVLEKLLILDGERLSYRTLDVEQIGSVYEAIMGFSLEIAGGRSIAIKAKKTHGAPATINLETLLATKAADRNKWLKEQCDQELSGKALEPLKDAKSIDDLLAALDKKIAKDVTPNVAPKGAMVLQPSDERRRSGSHYTPRSLTEPIVRKTLEPILKQLTPPLPLGEGRGEGAASPTPDQILALKVCDPAMGSGAFLVEACRQLGDELVKAWHLHNCVPRLPPDEDEILHARRLVAQRCLYGVDKNPMAVDLAKLSLWLATLAKDHPFTFLDHSLRAGDSLVGLSRDQIAGFHWDDKAIAKRKESTETKLLGDPIAERMRAVTAFRNQILLARDEVPYEQLRQQLDLADESLELARFAGDLVVAAFFSSTKDKDRVANLDGLSIRLAKYMGPQSRAEDREPLTSAVKSLRTGDRPITPFHWEIEFPEVFIRDNSGFDSFVGNPPFAGKNTIGEANCDGYLDWLKAMHEESHGNADLVAHFFRRAFNLLRPSGTFGLIATNTIAQGDTRSSGLKWICTHSGTIYAARRRYKWPGQAAVVVSVVHLAKGLLAGPFELDGKPAERITAYLFHAGGHDDPQILDANEGKSFQGTNVLGMGFTFDDTDTKGVASTIAEMKRLIAKDPRNAERIFPFIGGEEINDDARHRHHRYVISFGEMSELEARKWPDLMEIVIERVKPERDKNERETRRKYWWRFGETTPALFRALDGQRQSLVCALTSKYYAWVIKENPIIYSHGCVVFPKASFGLFATLQSQIHCTWAKFFASTLEDRLRYTPSDCFETFPFPRNEDSDSAIDGAGRKYYEFRAEIMVKSDEGLTKTYNRFHDPDERSPEILKLRELHDAMDRAVLDAYGGELAALKIPPCEFLLDYEDEEDDDDEELEAPAKKGKKKKKPWRYRWPDEFRDQVLALLLELNRTRAEQEALKGPPVKAPKKSKSPSSDNPTAANTAATPLFKE